ADDAGLELFAAPGEPVEYLPRAVDRGGLFVARDEKTYRSTELAARRDEALGRRGETRDRAFHVGRAAAIDRPAEHGAAERIDRPGFGIARRHHVSMAGEAE